MGRVYLEVVDVRLAVSVREQEYTPILRGDDLYFCTCLYVFTYYYIGHACLPTLPLTRVPVPFLLHAFGASDMVRPSLKCPLSVQDLCSWQFGPSCLPPNLVSNASEWQCVSTSYETVDSSP